jgi:hypothetical protein
MIKGSGKGGANYEYAAAGLHRGPPQQKAADVEGSLFFCLVSRVRLRSPAKPHKGDNGPREPLASGLESWNLHQKFSRISRANRS